MDLASVENTYDVIKERMAYMPKDYKSFRMAEVSTVPVIDLQQVFTRGRKYQPSPIWRIQAETKKFYTPKPILVKIYRDEGLFFAENENLVVCGTGNTPQEALKDLSLHITYFFKYYKKLDRSRLTGDALRLKDLYENLLIEE